MILYLLILNICAISATAYGALAGGRPNAFSGGQNAFAGVVNPANAVWLADRFDIGAFWVHQKVSLTNHDNNPFFPPGKVDFTYRSKNLITADAAIHKQIQFKNGSNMICTSIGLAVYSLPSQVKLRTKIPIPASGTTPEVIRYRTEVISAIFSFKLNSYHSVGFAIDYLYLSHRRDGFQNSDNPLRSVSPGHVTNNGSDHSKGIGCVFGWRWKITEDLDFGAAYSKKSFCGQFRKYRGFEPHHARNFTPQMLGAGFTYRFTKRLSGRLETLWVNEGDLPYANNLINSDGSLNLNKRGSDKSPGPGLQDATYLNIGLGYLVNSMLSVGAGYSHRFRHHNSPIILSHIYRINTVYDVVSLGVDFNYCKHNLFMGAIYGFRNTVSGVVPIEAGGGRFTGSKRNASLSISWGYRY